MKFRKAVQVYRIFGKHIYLFYLLIIGLLLTVTERECDVSQATK
jgi:hypothetical protein